MTHDFACRYEKIRAFAEKFLADGGLLSAVENYIIVPGLCDVHVHFREPGFSYKETIASGSAAAAHGGYTAVCTMPNLDPVPDSAEHLQVQLDAIKRGAAIKVLPYGAITVGEKGEKLADMEAMSDKVCAFSDDGKGVQNDEMMREAMTAAKRLGKIIAAHCEDNSLLFDGYIHDGEYARMHGHRGISSASEYKQIERDLRLAEETGCAYHICHISTKESVELIRQAKARGVNVTCETAPHYLLLDDSVYDQEDYSASARYICAPPMRKKEDRAIQDEPAAEKPRGQAGSYRGHKGRHDRHDSDRPRAAQRRRKRARARKEPHGRCRARNRVSGALHRACDKKYHNARQAR